MKLTYKLAFALILGAMFATLFLLLQKPWQVGASGEVSNQYQSTTTSAVADLTNLCPARVGQASSTTGVLGSVNVLVVGGALEIFDATTTNANLRSAEQSTSTIRLAPWTNAPVAGSYHFDIEFKRGLLVDYTSTGAGVSSTTISYRCDA